MDNLPTIPLPVYCPYISTPDEGTTSEQWTKTLVPNVSIIWRYVYTTVQRKAEKRKKLTHPPTNPLLRGSTIINGKNKKRGGEGGVWLTLSLGRQERIWVIEVMMMTKVHMTTNTILTPNSHFGSPSLVNCVHPNYRERGNQYTLLFRCAYLQVAGRSGMV